MTTVLLPAALLQTIPQGVDYIRILPELVCPPSASWSWCSTSSDEEKSQKLLGFIALGGHGRRPACHVVYAHYPGLAFSNMVKVDNFSVFFPFSG